MNFAISVLVFLIVSIGGAVPGIAAQNRGVQVVPSSEVPGARVVVKPGKVPVVNRANRIAPAPAAAGRDKAQLAFDGCMAYRDQVDLPECVYGNRSSAKSVVLFGDSRAMQYFPALLPLARQRDWRLTGLVRADCVASLIVYERFCDTWRKNMLERIEAEDPDMVILGSATKNLYRVTRNGQTLSRGASQPFLVDGMVRLIRSLKADGAQVVVIRDQSPAPFDPPDCVAKNIKRLKRCAFKPVNRKPRAFELTAARRTGTRVIDPQPMFCSPRLCPAVIGEAIVNKDNYHLTATYSRTLSRWLGTKIPDF